MDTATQVTDSTDKNHGFNHVITMRHIFCKADWLFHIHHTTKYVQRKSKIHLSRHAKIQSHLQNHYKHAHYQVPITYYFISFF